MPMKFIRQLAHKKQGLFPIDTDAMGGADQRLRRPKPDISLHAEML